MIVVFAFAALALAADNAGGPVAVRTAYEELRDAIYNSETPDRFVALYERAIDVLGDVDLPEADRLLWRSRIEYMVARGYQAVEDKKQAIAHYESGISFLDRLQPDRVSSESWRMTSECVSQLCLLKSTAYVITNGPKVSTYAEKALALDPRNAAAKVIIAAAKVYPPAMFGGNPKRGIELMQDALATGTADRDDLFNIYSGIGLAYGKLKDTENARRWLEKALELYPGNAFAREEYRKLTAGT